MKKNEIMNEIHVLKIEAMIPDNGMSALDYHVFIRKYTYNDATEGMIDSDFYMKCADFPTYGMIVFRYNEIK